MSELEKEGIALDLKDAIKSFKSQIDPNAVTTYRLFSQDLHNNQYKFLDIGCGIGRHMLILKNNGAKNIIGFDIVRDLVMIGKQEFCIENIFVGNALHIPFPDRIFDRVLMYNVIEHCSDTKQVLLEVSRILSEDGFLYCDVPNARSMGDTIFRTGSKIVYGKTSHIQLFTLEKIENLIERTNFKIIQCITHKGIYLDYPQLEKFTILKMILKLFFNNETIGWEFQLAKQL